MTRTTAPDAEAVRHSLTVTIAAIGPMLYGYKCTCGVAGNGEAPRGSTNADARACAERDHDAEHRAETISATSLMDGEEPGYLLVDCTCGAELRIPEGGDEYGHANEAARLHPRSAPGLAPGAK
jgi:hypothetical protein